MSRFIDLTGQIFGKLMVVALNRTDKKKGTYWLCRCSCPKNTEKVVNAGNLKNGHVSSCGCLQEESRINNLTGRIFGRLTVLGMNRIEKGSAYWTCQCSCLEKNIKIVTTNHLTQGGTQSCGCLLIENVKKLGRSLRKDRSGQTFGKLTAICVDESVVSENTYWICECSCDNRTRVSVSVGSLISGHASSCGCLHDSKISFELKKYLQKTYSAIPEYKILKNPLSGYWLPYDIFIPEFNVYIEVQGIQHYEFNAFFYKKQEDLKYRQFLDLYKKDYAEKHGVFIEIDSRRINSAERAIAYVEDFLNNVPFLS